jgi:hypothetical protein
MVFYRKTLSNGAGGVRRLEAAFFVEVRKAHKFYRGNTTRNP